MISAASIGTFIGVSAFLAGIVRWLIGAWNRAVNENPARDAIVLTNMNGIVVALNAEIDRVQFELDKLRAMVKVLEADRDLWKQRAITLGWVEDKE